MVCIEFYRARITDALGNTSEYDYDSWNRVVSFTNNLGEKSVRRLSSGGRVVEEQSGHGGEYEYEYEYDGQGNISGAGESGSAMARAEYNSDGSIRRTVSRLGETTEYSYGVRGLVSKIEGDGRTVWYEYDGEDRVVLEVVGACLNRTGCESYTEYMYREYE